MNKPIIKVNNASAKGNRLSTEVFSAWVEGNRPSTEVFSAWEVTNLTSTHTDLTFALYLKKNTYAERQFQASNTLFTVSYEAFVNNFTKQSILTI